MKFNEIIVGNYFMFNGNKYRKNSTCSAKRLDINKTSYFASNEVIQVVLGESVC
jgi:hypothetical protein